jgi:hypothetical protein
MQTHKSAASRTRQVGDRIVKNAGSVMRYEIGEGKWESGRVERGRGNEGKRGQSNAERTTGGSDCHVGCCSNGLSDNKKRCTSFPGNPLLPRDSNAENLECTAGAGKRRRGNIEGKERAESSTIRTLRRRLFCSLARGIACSSPGRLHSAISFLPRQPSLFLWRTPFGRLSSFILLPVAANLTSGRRKKCVCVWTLAR